MLLAKKEKLNFFTKVPPSLNMCCLGPQSKVIYFTEKQASVAMVSAFRSVNRIKIINTIQID